jgi:hypothetical protein
VAPLDWSGAMSTAVVQRDAAFKALSREDKLRVLARSNVSACRNPMRTYLRRRILLDPRDRACVLIGERLAEAMIADKGGPDHVTAGERALIENAVVARIVSLICLREVSEKGAFIETEQGRIASAGLATLAKFLGAERQAIQAAGISRRAAPALRLNEYLAHKNDGPIPVEAKVE